MKIVITAGELIDSGVWEEFCDVKGINPWAVNEGLMDSDEEFELTIEEAKLLNIISGNEEE